MASWAKGASGATWFTAGAVLLGMQSFRVFVTDMVWVVGETSNRAVMGALALGVLLLALLAWPLLKLAGERRTVLWCGLLLATARVADQAVASAAVDLALGAVGTLAFAWLAAAYLAGGGRTSGAGVAWGLAADVAARAALRTVDLPFASTPLAVGITFAAVALVALLAWAQSRDAVATSGRGLWTFAGLPPTLVLFMLVSGNFGQVSAMGDLGWAATAAWVTAGAVAGATWASLRRASGLAGFITGPVLASDALIGGVVAFELGAQGWGAGLAGAGLGYLASSLAAAGPSGPRSGREAGPLARAGVVTVGLVIMLAFTFVFYAAYAPAWVFPALTGLVVAAGMARGAFDLSGKRALERGPSYRAAGVLLILTVLPGALQAATFRAPAEEPARAGTVRVLSYNIRQGFGLTNRWNLEEVAREIERHSPDVVALQEAGRGWVISGMADQVIWLAGRLGMNYHFGSNIGDLWGNAVLTRRPAISENFKFETPGRVPRGVLTVRLPAEQGGLTLLVTHLDHEDDGQAARLDQIDKVFKAWGGSGPMLLVGDFNATPDSAEYETLIGVGLRDLLRETGKAVATSPADAPSERIDYAFGTKDLEVLRAESPRSLASDHLPVLVELRLP